jgi:hypothetical protein
VELCTGFKSGRASPGYDANVTNWMIPMTGTMNANAANFTINHQLRVL